MEQLDILKIRQATDSAIQAGCSSANPRWRSEALLIIKNLCESKPEISANEFTTLIKRMPIKTHDNRAIGGLVRYAEKMHWIEKTGRSEISKAGHLSRIQIWRSLVYRRFC